MADPASKIPGNEDFGKRVIAAREARGWNQEHLATRVGTSQPTISAIEQGNASSYIPDVCRVLKIPGPLFGFTPDQTEWTILGHRLQERSPKTFAHAMGLIQQMLDALPPTEPDEPSPPPSKPPKKMRAIGSANLTGLPGDNQGELRKGDELPGESKSKR